MNTVRPPSARPGTPRVAPSRPALLVRQALLLSCALLPGSAAAVIAQESLIIKDRDPVEPNLVFTLDDSGSMAFNYLLDPDPEVIFSEECKRRPGGGCSEHEHIFAYHPGEPRGAVKPNGEMESPDRRPYGVYITEGLVGTDDRHLLGIRQRSAQVNALYYDPETRYLPWVDANGKDMPDADPRAVIYHVGHPQARFGQLKLDITGEHPVGQYRVCISPRPPIAPNYNDLRVTNQPCLGDESIRTVAPATYYELKKGPNGQYLPNNRAANFTRVSIKDHQSFTRSSRRDDCRRPGEKSDAPVTCTQAQEYQNFANWFQYHRTRMHVAIAAVGRAFSKTVDQNVRVGYGRINKSEASNVDGVPTQVLERGVRRFEGNDRRDFFTWLNGRLGDGGTPLMRAMRAVGRYYERPDDQGPWSWKPGKGDGREHLSCRRSYHILMTDGQYNFGTAVGERQEDFNLEADSNVGNRITGPGNQSYQYRPQAPYNGRVSGSLADYAAHYWRTDLRPDVPNEVPLAPAGKNGIDNPSFWQNMTTFTLGFGVEGTLTQKDWPALLNGTRQWPDVVKRGSPEATDDLWHAGVNGRGGYLDVKNSSTFLSELQDILVKIKGRPGSVGGVTVSSRTLQSDNQKFVPSFRTQKWYGNLKAYALDTNGMQGVEQWSAVKQLPGPANRRMFVSTGKASGSRVVPLRWDASLPDDVRRPLLEGAGLAEGHTAGRHNGLWLVDFLRGDRSQQGEGKLFRAQPVDEDFTAEDAGAHVGFLGHIVHSSPVYIGAPIDRGYRHLPARFGHADSGAATYRAFLRGKSADQVDWGANGAAPACRGGGRRPGLVFVGANDGFLHAFDAACGMERFAWAPHAVVRELGRSSRKDYQPRFLMDGPLVEGDAYLNGQWANVLVGSTGAGPAALFALNVTETRAADNALGARSVMWELAGEDDADLGHVLQQPEIGVLADGRWVVVTGNGYESRSGVAKLLVLELATGRVIARLSTGIGDARRPNGLGGVRLIRDGNQVITGAYAGDLRGNLWKFDLASSASADWKVAYGGSPVFRTHQGRPIVVAPTLVSHPLGGRMVLVGTGKLFEVGDNRKPPRGQPVPVEALYGLWDKGVLMEDANGRRSWKAGDRTIEASEVLTRRVTMTADGRHAIMPVRDNPAPDWKTQRGWRIDQTMIAAGGQRSIVPAELVSGLALFETMSPLVDEKSLPCLEEVKTPAFSLLVDPISGRMATKAVIDTDGNRVVNDRDTVVAGWAVDDWKGRSVVLQAPPPPPCADGNCQQPAGPAGCPPDRLTNNLQNVDQSMNICPEKPAPARWWWRELSIPDKDYATGTTVPDGEGG